MVNGSLRYPFLLKRVSALQSTLFAGCGISGLHSSASMARSLRPLVSQWSGTLRLIYRLVFTTTYLTRKASHILASKEIQGLLNVHAYSISDRILLDPDLMDDRTSDSSATSIRRHNFAQEVNNRDRTCLVTGAVTNTEVCHIIPHAKGNEVLYYFIQFGTLRDALPACRNFDFGRPQI